MRTLVIPETALPDILQRLADRLLGLPQLAPLVLMMRAQGVDPARLGAERLSQMSEWLLRVLEEAGYVAGNGAGVAEAGSQAR
jgi:hypothetical protein